ncbi:4-(cytidine 5'-diphospho)-2-C-methyl-D-erythritol kinase [Sphingomonas sp. KC8]|uniref:4-(cytidine 5'-diphospho)-2-C-methyl-D-erythritol kinase n=1 Tax=Sphingomonas sp. KC8 TaxID=1030157 RepID=UPI000A31B7C6|nr:4-diphosphocytidyl-2C-methyl-D-erythritol kinase [Sphingomonas sp. KC8]
MIDETGHAKINLALHVRARGADGYHAIETIFAFARDGDGLAVTAHDRLSLKINGPYAAALADEDVESNLVLRAARAVQAAFAVSAGAAITLDKRLPVASGIGGGSADAAAALRALARLWNLPMADPRFGAIAAELGADVPACLASRTAWADGRGDRLTMLAGDGLAAGGLAGMPLLLVNPHVACPTGPVFRGWDGLDRGPLDTGEPLAAALAGRNDLEPPAIALVPEIARAVALLGGQPGVKLARMSGSGATCFALFDGQAARAAAAQTVRIAEPGWWCLETELL